MRLQAGHIILLVVLVLLLFGANRLPDLARSVGKSLKILKSEVKDLADDDRGERSDERRDDRPSERGTDEPGGGSGPTPRSGPDGSTRT